MFFYVVFVFWVFFATTVKSFPQNSIEFIPTDISQNSDNFVDDTSVASAATALDTGVALKPSDTTKDSDSYLDDENFQDGTGVVVPDFNGLFHTVKLNCPSIVSCIQ